MSTEYIYFQKGQYKVYFVTQTLPKMFIMIYTVQVCIYIILFPGLGYCTCCYRLLSRRLDRCDRVIQDESSDPNGGNMCSFSGATCMSRVRHNANYVPYAQIRFDL